MKIRLSFFLFLFFFIPSSAFCATYNLIPPSLSLQPASGPYPYGGRGVIVKANQDFNMTSFGMDLYFPGTLDFAVEIYQVTAGARGSLLSSSSYPGLTDDGSAYFTLNHSHTFVSGQIYEIMFRFSNPGPIFTHYEFENSSLNEANGFVVGTIMTVLDGSDFSVGQFENSWLANFQINTDENQEPRSIPTLSEWGMILMALILAGAAFAMIRRRQMI
jgi:hypothetical protein